jgi:RNA polymerase primary sigma factor
MLTRDPVSLDVPVRNEGETALGDLLEGRSAASILDPLLARDLREQTHTALKALTPAEEEVIRMRFGIGYEREPCSASDSRWVRLDARANPPDRAQGAGEAP